MATTKRSRYNRECGSDEIITQLKENAVERPAKTGASFNIKIIKYPLYNRYFWCYTSGRWTVFFV